MDQFKQTIEEYLVDRALSDEMFAASYAKEGKSINGCVAYILGKVRKSKREGFTDDEIFSMAVHYYDEDNIKQTVTAKCDVTIKCPAPKKTRSRNKTQQVVATQPLAERDQGQGTSQEIPDDIRAMLL